MKRKICVFTGTRADYGILSSLMTRLKNDSQIRLSIVASGMHLSSEYGLTCNEIFSDGFKVDETVEMLVSSDTNIGISKSIGLGILGLAEAFKRIGPDLVVILGDRFEAFAAAASLMVQNIPIAHIHGGELSFGSIDESMRHCITKMSHLHFTSTETYRNRVIQLGEAPETVFDVGALGVENIRSTAFLTKEAFHEKTNVHLDEKTILVTFHPATRDKGRAEEQVREVLGALDQFPDHFVIFTRANADEEGRIINQMLEIYTQKRESSVLFSSMGKQLYLSALKHGGMVLGNSSSGIIEAPALATPTVNIGSRQDGRIKPKSVIDCKVSARDIISAVNKAMSPGFAKEIEQMQNPYEKAGTAKNITHILKTADLDKIVFKRFYDIPGQ